MRTVNLTVFAIIATLFSGCGNSDIVVLESVASPDGKYLIWLTNESGGLSSGVLSLHLTGRDEKPALRNTILKTPECSGVDAGWVDSSSILVIYDDIYVSSFHSSLTTGGPRIFLSDRRMDNMKKTTVGKIISIACDHY